MTDTISLKATWNHEPLKASDVNSLAYLLLDITQLNAPSQPVNQSRQAAMNLKSCAGHVGFDGRSQAGELEEGSGVGY